jgi:hypothetical protein
MTLPNLQRAFMAAVSRKCVTAAEARAHLQANGWTDLWAAFQASQTGNWYSFKAALAGKPGYQKQLRRILAMGRKEGA